MTRKVLFSTQRNEGPFLLEWVAFHLAIGFEQLIIFSNDCTDGSDRLLDVLQRHVPLHHCIQVVQGAAAPQHQAQDTARHQGLLKAGDWVCWLDIDEFINIHVGDGRVADLRNACGPADGICLNWKIFGSAGLSTWPGRQLDPAFSRCGSRFSKSAQFCKTFFRYSEDMEFLTMHRPVMRLDAPRDRPVWCRADGATLPQQFVHDRLPKGLPSSRVPGVPSYKLGQINHYAVRTPDLYPLRVERGDGSVGRADVKGLARRYTARHFRRYDRNFWVDTSIQRHAAAVDRQLYTLRAIQDVNQAHLDCVAAAGLPVC
jgi:hypothetical protein